MKVINSHQQIIRNIKLKITEGFHKIAKHPVLSLIGGLLIGLGLPIGACIFSVLIDLLFTLFGIIILAISYYYTFVYKNN